MGSGRESFLGTVSRPYPVRFVGGLKPIRLRPGRDVLKSAPNSWLCLTLAPELSKPFNFDPMHVEGTPSTRHPVVVSARTGPSINRLTKFQGGSQHNFSEHSPPVALIKTIALTPHWSPPPRARGASSLCHCRSEDIPRGIHEPSGTHAAFMEAPSLGDGGWWSPQVEPRRRRLGGWQPMTVVPPHSCKRIPDLPTEKYNFTMPLDVAYKYPEDTTVDEEVYINSHLLLNFFPSLFCFIWCWPWPPLNLWHTLGLLRANS